MKVLRRMATASGEQKQMEAAASGKQQPKEAAASGESAQENGDGER